MTSSGVSTALLEGGGLHSSRVRAFYVCKFRTPFYDIMADELIISKFHGMSHMFYLSALVHGVVWLPWHILVG